MPNPTTPHNSTCVDPNIAEEVHKSGARVIDTMRPAYRAAAKAKKQARQCIGVEWALDQLLNHLPEDASKLQAHGITISTTLAKKQVELPQFLEVVLTGMSGMSGDAAE